MCFIVNFTTRATCCHEGDLPPSLPVAGVDLRYLPTYLCAIVDKHTRKSEFVRFNCGRNNGEAGKQLDTIMIELTRYYSCDIIPRTSYVSSKYIFGGRSNADERLEI